MSAAIKGEWTKVARSCERKQDVQSTRERLLNHEKLATRSRSILPQIINEGKSVAVLMSTRSYNKMPLRSNWPDRRLAVGTELGNRIEVGPKISEVTVLAVRMIVEKNVSIGELESRWCSI